MPFHGLCRNDSHREIGAHGISFVLKLKGADGVVIDMSPISLPSLIILCFMLSMRAGVDERRGNLLKNTVTGRYFQIDLCDKEDNVNSTNVFTVV